MIPLEAAAYLGFGILAGACGTLTGTGAGLLVMPLLVLGLGLPGKVVAGTSLVVLLFEAASGTCTYAEKKMVDWPTALLFAAAAAPGAFLGPRLLARVPEKAFLASLGILAVGIVVLFIRRPRARRAVVHLNPMDYGPPGFRTVRQVTDARGNTYRLRPIPAWSVLLGVGAGFVSSMLGVGSGVIHAPVLVYALGFPAPLAVATSHAAMAISAAVSVVGHQRQHGILWPPALAMGLGALAGARLGIFLSGRLRGASPGPGSTAGR